MASTYLTFAWRAATGFVTFSGVVSLDRLFLSDDADKLLGSFADLNGVGGLRWAVCVALAMEVGKDWTGQVTAWGKLIRMLTASSYLYVTSNAE